MSKSKSAPGDKAGRNKSETGAKKLSKQKKDVHDRIGELEERVAELEDSILAAVPQGDTATIDFEVKFFGGAGEIQFVGQSLDRKAREDTTFSIDQSKKKQRVQVGGTAPVSANGRIEVQVKQDTQILSPFSDNVFKNRIDSEITYIVK